MTVRFLETAIRVGAPLVFALSLAACARACDGASEGAFEAGSPSPPLPVLAHDPEPLDGAPARDAGNGLSARLLNLMLRRGLRDDTVELRPARAGDDPSDPKFRIGSQFSQSVGVASVTFFHGSFVKAHPGFSLTKPVLMTPQELAVLANELAEMAMTVLAAGDLAAAKARWGKGSPLLAEMDRDDEWAATRPVLAETARALSAKAKAHADAKEGLWVLAH